MDATEKLDALHRKGYFGLRAKYIYYIYIYMGE